MAIAPASARFAGTGTRPHLLMTVKSTASLTEVDIETGDVLARAVIGNPETEKPHELILTPDGTRAFVSIYGTSDYGNNKPSNKIAVVDVTTMKAEPPMDLGLYRGPHGLALDPDGMLWVTVEENQCALVIDPVTREIEKTVWLQVPAHFSALSRDGKRIFFSHKEYPFVTVVDVASRRIVDRIECPRGAQAIHVSTDGKSLYITDFNRPLLHRADLATNAIDETVALTGIPGWPFPLSDGRHVVVTTYDEPADRGFAEILDTDNLSQRRVIDLPAEPFHLHEAGNGKDIYVVLGNGQIPRIDVETGELANETLDAGGQMPEAVLVYRR